MNSSHRQALEAVVEASADLAPGLRGLAGCVVGASGFLAASLIVFLDAMNRRYDLGIRLFASARRPREQVRLFDFLGVNPTMEWQVAPVESVELPSVPGMVIWHAASYGSPVHYLREPVATYQANAEGMLHLFDQAKRKEAGRVVYFSSAEIYGQPPEACIPTREDYIGGVDTLSVRSIYAESKRMAEVLGNCLSRETGIPLTLLRPWSLYGPGQRRDDGRVPMEFVRQAREEGGIRLASDGTPRRAFCYVWDGIRQIVATLALREALVACNIGNGSEEIEVLDLARRCAEACGLGPETVTWDPQASAGGLQRCVPDVGLARRLTGDTPGFTPLVQGLSTLVEWLDDLRTHDVAS